MMLSNDGHKLLKVAATIGNEFDADLCLRIGGVSRDEINLLLDEATSSGIILSVGQGRYRFAHALVRGAIYDALDSSTRTRLHGQIAETLESIHENDLRPHLDELAHHFRESSRTEKAIEYSHRAAKAAQKVFAYTVAAEHWGAALTLSEGRNDARRARILFAFGRMAAFHLDLAEGVRQLEAALALYRELRDEERVASANATLGLALASHFDYSPGMNVPRALEHFEAALAWKGVWKNPGGLGWLHQGLAVALFQVIRIDEGILAVKLARQAFENESNSAWVVAASVQAQFLVIKGSHRAAAALFGEVAEVVQGLEDPEHFRSAMWYAGWCRMLLRDPLEAKRFLTVGMERPGLSPHQRARHFEFLALIELLAGDLARAKALAAEHQVNPTFRSMIALREGNWEAAIEMQLAMVEWARRTGHRWNEANALSILFDIIRLTGDLARATEVFRQALRSYEPGILLFEMNNRPQGVQLALEAGRHDEALEHLQRCRAIRAQGEDWLGRTGLAERAEAMMAAAEGRDFAPYFEKSIGYFRRYCLPWDEADTWYDWGVRLNAARQYSGANEKFDAAVGLYLRHGAGQRWIDRAESQRQRRAEPPVATFAANAASPTIYRREGDYWCITHDGKTFRLRNVKGLAYLAHLLAHPGERVHVFDLVDAVEGGGDRGSFDSGAAAGEGLRVRRGLGDAGDLIDPQARDEYRRRRDDLRAELEEARQHNDPGHADAARHELELLTDQLNAAVGRGGRARKNHAHGERARSLVTKHLRGGLDLIRRHDAELANHLDRSISTGAFCAYLPDPEDKPRWQL
jgi:tetratricopeptide (TPR) repeat protein